ncbi:MAG: MBOAT family protein [Butyrivibrio sp.]|nr:MBOAT family protein [Butyrivibrio sp.]
MLFTSYEFIGFYILLLILYYIIPMKRRWISLLLGSYLFYYAADPGWLYYILAVTVLTYLTALAIERDLARQKAWLKEHKAELGREEKRVYKDARKKKRRAWLALCLVLVLGILAQAKYTNFFISILNGIAGSFGGSRQLSFVKLALPLGISFYTFQAIGYLVDVSRESIPAEKNFLRYALFISFFPQLIQGPISRFGDLSQTLWAGSCFNRANLRGGLSRMLWGYFKKLVVADRLASAVNLMIGSPDTYRGAYALVLMVFYTIELYADFTGGIDITIGIAQTFGIRVKENFMRPYFSKSLKEYWRRWHISMSAWFKDYVLYPISTSAVMQRFSKAVRKRLGERAGKRLPVYLSSFAVWLATGIWHGASGNFVVWGLLNWAVLMISEELQPLYQRFHKRFSIGGKWGYKLFQTGRTFALVCVLNLFDCYAVAAVTLGMLGSLFHAGNWNILADGSLLALGLSLADYGVLSAGILLMLAVSLIQRQGSVRERIGDMPWPLRTAIWFGLFLMILLWGAYGIGYDASQFIYNQF